MKLMLTRKENYQELVEELFLKYKMEIPLIKE
jgi:hypothetical protein